MANLPYGMRSPRGFLPAVYFAGVPGRVHRKEVAKRPARTGLGSTNRRANIDLNSQSLANRSTAAKQGAMMPASNEPRSRGWLHDYGGFVNELDCLVNAPGNVTAACQHERSPCRIE